MLGRILESNRKAAFVPTEQTFYEVYGKVQGEWRKDVQDFSLAMLGGEAFYPFLASQYEGIVCRKMRVIDPDETNEYKSKGE